MEATSKLANLAQAYTAHERTCHGSLTVSLPTLPFEDAERIELTCALVDPTCLQSGIGCQQDPRSNRACGFGE